MTVDVAVDTRAHQVTFTEVGERLTRALISGDFDLYRSVMDLPITIEPRGAAAYTLRDPAGLERDFDLYHRSIRARGVTDIYRKVVDIREDDEGRVEVRCLMHILVGSTLAIEPFISLMTLHRTEGGWRFCHIRSSLRHIQWTLGKSGL
jgi:hypothetical protein